MMNQEMKKSFPIGCAFEELSEDEMMEVDGAGTITTTLSTTTLFCVGASIIISGGVSLLVTATLCK